MPQIRLAPLIFYSPVDELLLFEWIKKVKAVLREEGAGNSLVLHFRSSRISDQDLRELLGIFGRYRFRNVKQLAKFHNKRNVVWLAEWIEDRHRELSRATNKFRLRKEIEIGWQESEKGELIEGSQVFREIRKLSREHRRRLKIRS